MRLKFLRFLQTEDLVVLLNLLRSHALNGVHCLAAIVFLQREALLGKNQLSTVLSFSFHLLICFYRWGHDRSLADIRNVPRHYFRKTFWEP